MKGGKPHNTIVSIEANKIPASTKRSFTGRAWIQMVFGFCTQKQHVYNKKTSARFFFLKKVRPLEGSIAGNVARSRSLALFYIILYYKS